MPSYRNLPEGRRAAAARADIQNLTSARPFVYIPATVSAPPGVISVGPDGVQGTADDVAPE